MKKYLLTALLVFAASNAFATIAGSKHDLSTTGPNATYNGSSDQICKYCHVPHNATNPKALWSRTDAANGAYTVYTNPGSLDAVIAAGGPTNTQSTACLACHNVTASTGPDASTNLANSIAITKTTSIGPNISNDHPIAFTYDNALVTADKATGSGVAGLYVPTSANAVGNGVGNNLPLYGGSLECASCHAVHGVAVAGTNIPMFLRTTAKGSAICLKCHIK